MMSVRLTLKPMPYALAARLEAASGPETTAEEVHLLRL